MLSLFSKIQPSLNVSRPFQKLQRSLSKNGIYEVPTMWWVQLIAWCDFGMAPMGNRDNVMTNSEVLLDVRCSAKKH